MGCERNPARIQSADCADHKATRHATRHAIVLASHVCSAFLFERYQGKINPWGARASHVPALIGTSPTDSMGGGRVPRPPPGLSLSGGGRAPRSPSPSLMLTPILVWGHPPCGHCHAGARQWSSVMVSLRSSLSLVEIMYSNSLGGIQSHETGPKRRPQRPPFGNPPTHHNTHTYEPHTMCTINTLRVARPAGGRVGCECNPARIQSADCADHKAKRHATRHAIVLASHVCSAFLFERYQG